MKNLTTLLTLTLVGATCLVGQQIEPDTREANYDELVAFLDLDPEQVVCLEDNRAALREALTPTFEQLRDLQAQLRLAVRNGEDTEEIRAQIEALRMAAADSKSAFVGSAATCLNSAQAERLQALVEAETLLNEIRQGKVLLLLEGTEERAGDRPDRRRTRRTRGRR